MEISKSYSGLMKKDENNSCIYLQDKALSSYIYIKNYQQINLDKKELEKDFLRSVLTSELTMSLADIYLTVLKTSEFERYEGLKHEGAFDLDEVVTSLSKDLTENFQKYGIIFFLLDKKIEQENPESNPLKDLIDRTYMKEFFDGLGLSYSEKVLFVLGIAQEEWGWLFPDFKNEEYKAHLFCHICGIQKQDEIAFSRKVNSELIRLGLFSSAWKIKSYVYSYFKNETPSFTLRTVEPLKHPDVYDYMATAALNKEGLEILRKLKGFMVIYGESDYRNKYFLAAFYKEQFARIHELKEVYPGRSKAELEFYIYALSLQLKYSPLFLNADMAKLLLEEDSDNPLDEIFHKKEGRTSLLDKIKAQVIFSLDNFSDETRSRFQEHGIDILYALQLKLPEQKEYMECFMCYCFEVEAPIRYLPQLAEECEKLAIKPEQWESVTKLLQQMHELTREEALELLRNKFSTSKSDNMRKNSHYCIEALNTSEPIGEVTDALKNADEYQKGEYDEESGIKVLLYGISGGGKTAYAEEVSKKMNKPLKIVRPSEVLSKWVGETEQNISRLFKEAAKEHSILLVDEADSFLHNRGDSVNHFEDSKVNSFLIEIERYPGILFCSTNLPDILDKAVDRRFNFKVGFKALTKEGVSLLCKSYFSSFEFDDAQVSKIYNSGEVTPGDFATLNGKLRFLAPEKRNSVYITEELCKIVRDKKRSYESNKIGFGN